MRYLILSDIHANWEALEAVVADAEGGYDQILCCGDVVGYGADPNRATEWVRERSAATVRGNHDRACVGLDDLEWFNPAARQSALWTQVVLTPDNREFLRLLPKGPQPVNGIQILHGSPVDEDEYLVSAQDAASQADYLECAVSFFGHTHLQGGFLCHPNGVETIDQLPGGMHEQAIELDRDLLYLINPGSVGQPRDHDPRAAYAIYVSDDNVVLQRRIAYDVGTAQQKIRAAGLPEVLALRLSEGM